MSNKESAAPRARSWRRTSLVMAAFGFALGLLAFGSVSSAMRWTNSENFCAGACHTMSHNANEHRDTIHDVNRTGVRATCSDCHVPREPVPLYLRKVGAVNDLWSHFITHSISTKEKFEAKRYELAKRVWLYMKESDSRECRNCHDEAKMSDELQSEKAQKRHAKGREQGLTCIDCHFGIAHEEPEGGPGPQELMVVRR